MISSEGYMNDSLVRELYMIDLPNYRTVQCENKRRTRKTLERKTLRWLIDPLELGWNGRSPQLPIMKCPGTQAAAASGNLAKLLPTFTRRDLETATTQGSRSAHGNRKCNFHSFLNNRLPHQTTPTLSPQMTCK